jgi:hypothetical protein
MSHSIFFKAGPDQSPSLWASHGPIGQENRLKKTPDGIASLAKLFCDCEQDLEAFCALRRAIAQLRQCRILRGALLQSTGAPDRFFLLPNCRPV